MKRKSSRSQAGISFLEILVAVAILSVSLVLIIQSLYLGLTAIRIDGDYFKASLLIDNVLSGLLTETVEPSAQEAQAKPPFDNYRYQIEVAENNQDLDPEIKKVKVLASWPSGVKERKTAISLYLPPKTAVLATEEK